MQSGELSCASGLVYWAQEFFPAAVHCLFGLSSVILCSLVPFPKCLTQRVFPEFAHHSFFSCKVGFRRCFRTCTRCGCVRRHASRATRPRHTPTLGSWPQAWRLQPEATDSLQSLLMRSGVWLLLLHCLMGAGLQTSACPETPLCLAYL